MYNIMVLPIQINKYNKPWKDKENDQRIQHWRKQTCKGEKIREVYLPFSISQNVCRNVLGIDKHGSHFMEKYNQPIKASLNTLIAWLMLKFYTPATWIWFPTCFDACSFYGVCSYK